MWNHKFTVSLFFHNRDYQKELDQLKQLQNLFSKIVLKVMPLIILFVN